MAKGGKGRTIPFFGETPFAASREASAFLFSLLGLDRLPILWIVISLELFPSAEDNDRGKGSCCGLGLCSLGLPFESSWSSSSFAVSSEIIA
uniref:Uncharacterized protein n=1 Tax=Rhizophora mucronata TaxID=61149 RepID=A0A2P2N3H5_RHIMU